MADFHTEGWGRPSWRSKQLAWVDQEPLYQIYLDLRKAYDALDWECCLEILAGYGVGPNLLHLQKNSGTMQRRYVARVVVMVYLLRLIMESHRGALFPASCSIFVSNMSLGSGSDRCWVKTSLEVGWEICCTINVLHSSWMTGWSQQDSRSGCNQVLTFSSTFSNGSASR
jgi:hypothetical protein